MIYVIEHKTLKFINYDTAKLKSCYRVWMRHLLTGSQVVAHITKLDFYELVSLFKIRFGSS